MGKKKKKDKTKNGRSAAGLESEVRRLRAENEILRARLEKIAELAGSRSAVPAAEKDDEDDEYDELARDVDDVIDDDNESAETVGVDKA